MFNKSQLFFIYKTKSVNLFQEMTQEGQKGLKGQKGCRGCRVDGLDEIRGNDGLIIPPLCHASLRSE